MFQLSGVHCKRQEGSRLRILGFQDSGLGSGFRVSSFGFGFGFGVIAKEEINLLVGYHGEPKVNLCHNIRISLGILIPQKVKGYLLYYEVKPLNPTLTLKNLPL